MNGFELAAPLALALLPAPLLMTWLKSPRSQAEGLRIPMTFYARIAGGRGSSATHARSLVLAWLAWIGLVLALAGPRMMTSAAALPASGRDIMLVLDLSGSMTKTDFTLDGAAASRLDVLKHVGSDLIRRRAGDRIGLVVFAETAFAAAPLSFDVSAVSQTLNEMEIGLVGRSTAIGEGLGLALKRLAPSTSPTRIVILLSDGANNAGASDPLAVADLARRLGVTIYTIGLGVNDLSTAGDDPEAVDFAALQHIAEIAGGAALRARTTEELAQAMDAIEKRAAGPALAPPTILFRELWICPATLALAASLVMCLAQRTFR